MNTKDEMVVAGSIAEVRARMEDQLVVIGDLWFPTRGEMKAWHQSPAGFYVKWT